MPFWTLLYMTRAEKIKAGRVWQVHPDDKPESVMFEGSRAACLQFLRSRGLLRDYRRGAVRLGMLIWEPVP